MIAGKLEIAVSMRRILLKIQINVLINKECTHIHAELIVHACVTMFPQWAIVNKFIYMYITQFVGHLKVSSKLNKIFHYHVGRKKSIFLGM